jgi:ornithine carbamoyltransferase
LRTSICWFSDKDKDNAETVLAGFLKYATVPIVNMEGCTGHPQALADAITIAEFQTPHRPKLYCHGLRIQSVTTGCSQFVCRNDAIARC